MTPAQFLIDFVTTDICQIIAAIIGEKVIDELFSVFKVSRFTRTQLPIDSRRASSSFSVVSFARVATR
jgi:hypothetical protein